MKFLWEVLTPEQAEELKSCFYVFDGEMRKITEGEVELTAENFKVYVLGEEAEDVIKVATVEDFAFYDPESGDYDFKIGDAGDYVQRGCMPEEVEAFLDGILKKNESDEGLNEEAEAAEEPKEEPAEEASEE